MLLLERQSNRAKMDEKVEVGLQLGLQSGVTFLGNWGYKTLFLPYMIERGKSPKNGVVYRKHTIQNTGKIPFLEDSNVVLCR